MSKKIGYDKSKNIIHNSKNLSQMKHNDQVAFNFTNFTKF